MFMFRTVDQNISTKMYLEIYSATAGELNRKQIVETFAWAVTVEQILIQHMGKHW